MHTYETMAATLDRCTMETVDRYCKAAAQTLRLRNTESGHHLTPDDVQRAIDTIHYGDARRMGH